MAPVDFVCGKSVLNWSEVMIPDMRPYEASHAMSAPHERTP